MNATVRQTLDAVSCPTGDLKVGYDSTTTTATDTDDTGAINTSLKVRHHSTAFGIASACAARCVRRVGSDIVYSRRRQADLCETLQ